MCQTSSLFMKDILFEASLRVSFSILRDNADKAKVTGAVIK